MKSDLLYAVDQIGSQFRKTLDVHEQDFINAYKIYMMKVRKELAFLKEKSNEANGKLMNDDRIT